MYSAPIQSATTIVIFLNSDDRLLFLIINFLTAYVDGRADIGRGSASQPTTQVIIVILLLLNNVMCFTSIKSYSKA